MAKWYWEELQEQGVESPKVWIFQKVLILIPMNDTTVHPFMYAQVTEESDQ